MEQNQGEQQDEAEDTAGRQGPRMESGTQGISARDGQESIGSYNCSVYTSREL
ncbi:MAG: hypothetical protein WCK90_04865 [archaeon]